MTTGFKLSMPTDIPWRRICVSSDMMDPVTCDDERPARWHTSLAAFRYDPAEDYQPYENEVVSYLKVVATIAPFQFNEPGITPTPAWVPPKVADDVEQSFPCYGAILQVGVGPTSDEKDKFTVKDYPYFIDFEPKKRELYEAVTDTGEVLSGSLSSLTVGKAATDTHATEDYNLDLGGSGSFGVSAQAAGYGGSLSAAWDNRQQVGTVTSDTRQVQNVRTTDFSTERREQLSHSTQLSQMYNLFQAFHLGTNRALFFIEPRPHTRMTESTFINGPRATEGIQEVFMIVVRPKTMSDFCVSALLETAHLTVSSATAPSTRSKTIHWQVGPVTEEHSGSFNEWDNYEDSLEVDPDANWLFDTARSGGAYKIVVNKHVGLPSGQPQEVSITPEHVHMKVRLGKAGGNVYDADVTLYERSVEENIITGVTSLYLIGRELCCCPPIKAKPQKKDWVSYEKNVKERGLKARSGVMSRSGFAESRRVAFAVRDEILRSFTSSQRYANGEVSFVDSDTFHRLVAEEVRASALSSHLEESLAETSALDDDERGKLYAAFGDISVGDILDIDGAELARVLSTDRARATSVKRRLIQAIAGGDSRNR